MTTPKRCYSNLTIWHQLLPYGYSYKASYATQGWAVIWNLWHPGTLTLTAERQSARMSQITNDGSTQSGTGCCTYMATVGVKGLTRESNYTLLCITKQTVPQHRLSHPVIQGCEHKLAIVWEVRRSQTVEWLLHHQRHLELHWLSVILAASGVAAAPEWCGCNIDDFWWSASSVAWPFSQHRTSVWLLKMQFFSICLVLHPAYSPASPLQRLWLQKCAVGSCDFQKL